MRPYLLILLITVCYVQSGFARNSISNFESLEDTFWIPEGGLYINKDINGKPTQTFIAFFRDGTAIVNWGWHPQVKVKWKLKGNTIHFDGPVNVGKANIDRSKYPPVFQFRESVMRYATPITEKSAKDLWRAYDKEKAEDRAQLERMRKQQNQRYRSQRTERFSIAGVIEWTISNVLYLVVFVWGTRYLIRFFRVRAMKRRERVLTKRPKNKIYVDYSKGL